MANTISSCDTTIQLRRRPNRLVKKGTGSASINGAQININEYPNAAQLNMVTTPRSMPAALNHNERLEKISKMGIPAENPKNSMIITRESRYALAASTHDFLAIGCSGITGWTADIITHQKLR